MTWPLSLCRVAWVLQSVTPKIENLRLPGFVYQDVRGFQVGVPTWREIKSEVCQAA